MKRSLPKVGEVVEFYYPIRNEVGSRPKLRLRRLEVHSIRDLRESPLSLEDIIRRPYVRRGRYLFTGLDLDKGKSRNFYFDWSHRQKLVVIHSDGKPTKIKSGKTRFDSSCFAEICAKLPDDRGLLVTIKEAA